MIKYSLTFCFLILTIFGYSQSSEYQYKRSITGITDQWHSISLPAEITSKANSELHDIRILGVTAKNDTIEAPYLLKQKVEVAFDKEVDFQRTNQSHNSKGYFFTFKMDDPSPINQIILDFGVKNFDWLAKLEASPDQKEWFTIVDEQRLVSIKNGRTNFQFTQLNFHPAEYKYFRLQINSKEDPKLLKATIKNKALISGESVEYTPKSTEINDLKEKRLTEIILDMGLSIPLNEINIDVAADYDYYRPISFLYLKDSALIDDKWKYYYQNFKNETLNSIEENDFSFQTQRAQKFKIIIKNHDNAPLDIQSITTIGYAYELTARFTEEASYFLCYGNDKWGAPQYDLTNFSHKIPKELVPLSLGPETKGNMNEKTASTPLFANKAWLWGIMLVIIAVLGWFSLKMMKEK